jgi:hypothetical protein
LQSRCSPTELRPRGRRCPTAPPKIQESKQAPLARHQASLRILEETRFPHSGNLVGQGGLEPPTPRLSSVCSNQLSYWPRTCGVAQSREGCAVGAHRSFRKPQPGAPAGSGRQSGNQEHPMRDRPAPFPTPSGAGQARTMQGKQSMSGASQGTRRLRQSASLKGGDPAAGSPTATLLRLHPSR